MNWHHVKIRSKLNPAKHSLQFTVTPFTPVTKLTTEDKSLYKSIQNRCYLTCRPNKVRNSETKVDSKTEAFKNAFVIARTHKLMPSLELYHVHLMYL